MASTDGVTRNSDCAAEHNIDGDAPLYVPVSELRSNIRYEEEQVLPRHGFTAGRHTSNLSTVATLTASTVGTPSFNDVISRIPVVLPVQRNRQRSGAVRPSQNGPSSQPLRPASVITRRIARSRAGRAG